MNEHAYFRAIEERFIRLRGAPLLLSPADWQLAKRWWEAGIPLDFVGRTLEEIFARREEKGEVSPVQSLRYCASAVETAWRTTEKLQQADQREEAAPIAPGGRLARLAAALPEDLQGARELRAEILGLTGTAEEIETALGDIDSRMITTALAKMSEADRRELGHRADQSLAALTARMSRDEIEASRERLVQQIVRREAGLPLLSLFSDL